MNIWMYAFFWFDKTANSGIFLGSFKARAFDSNLSQDWFIHTGFSDLEKELWGTLPFWMQTIWVVTRIIDLLWLR